MSKPWVTVGIVAAVLAAGGIFVGTHINKRHDDAEAGAADDGADDADGAKKGKKKKGKRKKGKRKKGKKKKGKGKGKGDLESLGYLSAAEGRKEDQGKTGVIRHEPGKAHQGLTLVVPASATVSRGNKLKEAFLVDMKGKTLNKWDGDNFSKGSWVVGRFDDDGFLYILCMHGGVAKLDWAGNVVWEHGAEVHHDLVLLPDSIVALHLRDRTVTVPDTEASATLRDNGVLVLDRDGNKLREFWLYDLLREEPEFVAALKAKAKKKADKGGSGEIDIFHANAVEPLVRDVEGLGKAGDILISVRNLDLVIVASADGSKILWKWGPGQLQRQHDPRIDAAGNVVVFDNGVDRKRSRVLGVSPGKEIVWEFDGGAERFFSKNRGMSQPLPGGNVLVSVSNEAKLMEVTPDKEVVWDYYSARRHPGGRYPIRGVRITDAPLKTLQAIVAGERPEPAKGAAGGGEASKAAPAKGESKAEPSKAEPSKP